MSKIEFTNNNLLLSGRKFSAEVQSLFKNVVALFGLKESLLFVENVFSAPCAVSLRDFLQELSAKNSRISNGGVISLNLRARARPEFFTSLADLQLWETRGKASVQTCSSQHVGKVISAKTVANSTVLATKQTLPKSASPLAFNVANATSFPSQLSVRAYISGFKTRNDRNPTVRDIQKRFKEFKGDKSSWQRFLKANNLSFSV